MNLFSQPGKLFLLIAITGGLILSVFAYMALMPLDFTVADPEAAQSESRNFSTWLDRVTLLIYVILIFISNLIYRNTQKGIYLFYGWLFFSAFTLFSYIYIAETLFDFRKKTGLWEGESSLAFIAGVFLCLVAATAAFINYAVLRKVMNK